MIHGNQETYAELMSRDPYYRRDSFDRIDKGDDAEFYASDRFVPHVDSSALATIEHLIKRLIVEQRPRILDLMAGWDSHLSPATKPSRVIGLGLNYHELSRNEALNAFIIHDLNKDPRLPFEDQSFDAVLNTVSVDYLTRPFDVFADVARVLKPGGLFLVSFSNRMFETKATKIWRESSEEERIILVEDFFDRTGLFTRPDVFVSKNKPRPADDKYAPLGIPGDPVYAIFAERTGGGKSIRPRQLDDMTGLPLPDPLVLRDKLAEVGRTGRCPYCDDLLRKWQVPSNPFIEWDVDYMSICFNDQCPYFVRGWNAMYRGGGRGFSHRFMYDPVHDRCLNVPVPTVRALRDGIRD